MLSISHLFHFISHFLHPLRRRTLPPVFRNSTGSFLSARAQASSRTKNNGLNGEDKLGCYARGLDP